MRFLRILLTSGGCTLTDRTIVPLTQYNGFPLYVGIRYEVKQTMYEQVNVLEELTSDDPSKLYEVYSSEEAMECNLCKSKKAIDHWKVQNGQAGI